MDYGETYNTIPSLPRQSLQPEIIDVILNENSFFGWSLKLKILKHLSGN